MSRTLSQSPHAHQALTLVQGLQSQLVLRLREVSGASFSPVSWLRDEGRHGGGTRLVADSGFFDRASVNVSAIHYDDLPDKRLRSATALSAIVHPAHPRRPSLHTHISHTELRDGSGYWRLMADLNPSLPDPEQTAAFEGALSAAAGEHWQAGKAQGERYFSIPALGRHRGVVHFYLEGFDSGDFAADLALARHFDETVIRAYAEILAPTLPEPTEAEQAAQLAYQTLYFFQVLTLDRGTTSGLLVHDQNDVGILGSLPSHIDRDLLASWRDKVPEVQRRLVDALVQALPASRPTPVEAPTKRALAAAVRAHYRAHPEALKLQARGNIVPPTVANHR